MKKNNNKMIDHFRLDKEEKAILDSVEKGEWQTVSSLAKEIELAKEVARNSLN